MELEGAYVWRLDQPGMLSGSSSATQERAPSNSRGEVGAEAAKLKEGSAPPAAYMTAEWLGQHHHIALG